MEEERCVQHGVYGTLHSRHAHTFDLNKDPAPLGFANILDKNNTRPANAASLRVQDICSGIAKKANAIAHSLGRAPIPAHNDKSQIKKGLLRMQAECAIAF